MFHGHRAPVVDVDNDALPTDTPTLLYAAHAAIRRDASRQRILRGGNSAGVALFGDDYRLSAFRRGCRRYQHTSFASAHDAAIDDAKAAIATLLFTVEEGVARVTRLRASREAAYLPLAVSPLQGRCTPITLSTP